MRLKELFKGSKIPISNLGTNKFRLSLDKEAIKTPHWVMNKVLNMLENRPSVMNGLRQHVRFLLNDIEFESEDEKTQEFANEWLEQRFILKKELFKFTMMLIGLGNSYLEPQYLKYTNGSKKLNTFLCFPDPSLVYKNLNPKEDESDYWIIEVPLDVRSYNGFSPSFYPIYYMRGSRIFRNMVYGIPRHKDSLLQFTTGWSRTNDYGWGLLSSAVDNDDVLEEILKNWALIAKFRSLGKKIIGFYNDNGESVDPGEIDAIHEQLAGLEEEDSLLVNKKFVSEDLSFTGNDNMMNQEADFLRRDTGASLTPNFMTPWSQDSSYATASESKVPFSLELSATQEELRDILDSVITKQLLEENNWLSKDLHIKLPDPQLYSKETLFNMMNQLYNMRACTFNELRESIGLTTVEGGDIWGSEPPLDKQTVSTQIQEKSKLKESFHKKYKEQLYYEPIKESKVNIVMESNQEVVNNKEVKFKEAVKGLLK